MGISEILDKAAFLNSLAITLGIEVEQAVIVSTLEEIDRLMKAGVYDKETDHDDRVIFIKHCRMAGLSF